MADKIKKIDVKPEENQWQIEDDARIIKNYYELKSDSDRYEKAINQLRKEDAAIQEGLKAANEYKASIGLAKK